MSLNLEHKNVLVVGLGVTGLSMAHWLDARGAVVAVADSRDNPPHAARLQTELPGVPLFTGKLREEVFHNANLLAVSPGVSLREPAIADALAHGVEVVGDIELFAQALRAQDLESRTQVIAITDSQMSALASLATAVLMVNESTTFGFRSLTNTMCLAQSLFIALAYRTELLYAAGDSVGVADR